MPLSLTEREVQKSLVFFIWGTILKEIKKYLYSSESEKRVYFNNNKIAYLLLGQFPLNIYAYDDSGNKTSFPFGIYDDESFIFEETHKETINSDVGDFLYKSELIRDNIYAFLYGLDRLGYDIENRHNIVYDVFCEILNIRYSIYRKYKYLTENRFSFTELIENDEIFYTLIIDYSLLDEEKKQEFNEQSVFFNHYVNFSAWNELVDESNILIQKRYKEIINNLSIQAINDPLDGYKFLFDTTIKIDFDRLLRNNEGRGTFAEYDSYPLKAFEKAKKYHKEIIQQKLLIPIPMQNTLPTIVILTAIAEEYNAVREHLEEIKDNIINDAEYEEGLFRMNGIDIAKVVIHECGQGNNKASQETERAIQYYKPECMFFVGIAGSRKPQDFKIGDVIVGDKIYGYEAGKGEKGKFYPAMDLEKSSYSIYQKAMALKRKNWKGLIKGNFDIENVKAETGNIASGEKIIEHYESEIGKLLSDFYPKTQAVETEGFGFATAASYQGRETSNIQIGVVRGISDILERDDKTADDKRPENVKKFASATAAAFTFAIIERLYQTDSEKKTPNQT